MLGKPYSKDYNILKITSPANDSVVMMPMINVSGLLMSENMKVTVNGIQAMVSGASFEAEGVPLARGMNTITATATNSMGKSMSESIRVRYKVPLKTFITFPFDGLEISGNSLDVEGIVSDNLATVSVNGVTATVSPDGRFIAKGVPLTEGTNQITATATNQDGETDTFTITITAKGTQRQPMEITITSPQNNMVINRPSVTVTGTHTSNADEVSVKVNGVLAEVSDGRFTANNVPLVEGANAIIVNAMDSMGATGRAEAAVTMSRTPYVTLNANITSGIPALTTCFTVSTEMPNPVSLYQMDFEGDGVIDYTGPGFDNVSFTYTAEGIHNPKLTVTDTAGNTYTDMIAITVLCWGQFKSTDLGGTELGGGGSFWVVAFGM